MTGSGGPALSRGAIVLLLGGAVLLLVACLPLFPLAAFTWHDQHRLGQILVFLLIPLFWLFGSPAFPKVRVNTPATIVLLVMLVLGGVSALLSAKVDWAMAELALFVCSFGLGTTIAVLLRRFEGLGDRVLINYVRLLSCAMVLQFYVACVAAWMHPDAFFHPWGLLSGFSNVRHQGQFLTMILPFLVAGVSLDGEYDRKLRGLDFVLGISLTIMVFVAGTRGTVFSWLIVGAGFMLLSGGARRLAVRMLLVVAGGYLLSMLLLEGLSAAVNQSADFRFSGTQVFGLTSREELWRRAVELMAENPWLGIGPMLYAGDVRAFAGHPHQALLQIASEWGGPVLLLVVFSVGRWFLQAFRQSCREDGERHAQLRWVLLFALSSSVVQSQVDGVLVMPYPQLWLAMITGWAVARFHQQNTVSVASGLAIPSRVIGVLLMGAASYLALIALRDLPSLLNAPEYCASGPRFWCNGAIGF